MPSHNPLPSEQQALARVVAGVGPTFASSTGFASVTRPALGRHILTLSHAMPVANVDVQVTRIATAHGSIAATVTSDTTIEVYTFDAAAAAADVNFAVTVTRIP